MKTLVHIKRKQWIPKQAEKKEDQHCKHDGYIQPDHWLPPGVTEYLDWYGQAGLRNNHK